MKMDIWQLLSALSKFGLYIGILFAVGTVFYGLLFENDATKSYFLTRKVTLLFSLSALIFSAFSYGILAASLTGNASAIFDRGIHAILWQTPASSALLSRIIGLVLVLIGLFIKKRGHVISLTGALIALASFAQIGHLLEGESRLLQYALLLHLIGISLWLGILLPLLKMSTVADQIEATASIAHKFGRIALIFVPILLAAGGWIAFVLTGSFKSVFTTGYGFFILVKISLVTILLALAAFNKLRFVPALRAKDETALLSLNKSVKAECIVVMFILATTAILTSILSLPSITT